MAVSDWRFSFVINVEQLESFVPTKQFTIKSEFANIFSLILKNPLPNEKKIKLRKLKGKSKVKKAKRIFKRSDANQTSNNDQTLAFAINIELLISYMMQYPMEVCLCNALNPEERIGSTLIPWHPTFIEYLFSIYRKVNTPAATVSDSYSIFDEATSKQMAKIRLTMKLCHIELEDIHLNQYQVLSEQYPFTYIKKDAEIKYMSITSILNVGLGVVKTIYRNGKHKKKSGKKRYAKREKTRKMAIQNRDDNQADIENLLCKLGTAYKVNRNLIDFIISETDIAKNKRVNSLHSKSCSDIVKPINPFDYIFCDGKGPYGRKIYTVGYVTVDQHTPPDTANAKASPSHSRESSKTTGADLGTPDVELTRTVKCENVLCQGKKDKHLEVPDERVLLGLRSLKDPCCKEKKVEITETVKGKITVDGNPCYCACECSFGFEKKTTYCEICGGYEKPGDDFAGKPLYHMPDPCPIYHKMNKIKASSNSGSESKVNKKRIPDKKKPDNSRFKFHYGYKGIPPQIGHSRCVLPCTGTLLNVPKSMGWLWTADNIPGLLVCSIICSCLKKIFYLCLKRNDLSRSLVKHLGLKAEKHEKLETNKN